jgi:hypothetical protein
MYTKEERLKFGLEAEEFCQKCFEKIGIKVLRSRDQQNWNSSLDRKIGDLILVFKEYVFIDIKRGSISKDSLEAFKGQYYFVYNVNLTELFIFKPADIQNCSKLSYVRLSSNDWGIKLDQLKRHVSFMTLDEFLSKLR